MNSPITRREFLTYAIGSGALLTSGCRSLVSTFSDSEILADAGPIDFRLLKDFSGFGGDDPVRAHAMLRDTKVLPKPTFREERRVVVIGGGLSGLFSTYLLRDLDPLVLEHASRFGGNAKAERLKGGIGALGSAYCGLPDRGSPLEKIFKELDLLRTLEVRRNADPLVVGGRWTSDFWNPSETTRSAKQRRRFYEYLEAVCNERDGLRYPEMPSRDPEMRAYHAELDHQSLREYFNTRPFGPLGTELSLFLESYSRSALGGAAHEISAAAGLAFLAAETGPICIGRGGNAEIAQRLFGSLSETLSARSLRASTSVLNVAIDGEAVEVLHQNARGEVGVVRARSVIMAIPKFIAARVLEDLEPSRRERFNSIEYRPYVVANVQLDQPIARRGYDIHLLNATHVEKKTALNQVTATDMIFSGENGTLLTLYCPLPERSLRAALLAPTAEEDLRTQVESQMHREILAVLGIPEAQIRSIRLVRWGHGIPLAKKGTYRGDTVEKLSEPIQNQIFFVAQDNWLLPAFESGALEAIHWTAQVRRQIDT